MTTTKRKRVSARATARGPRTVYADAADIIRKKGWCQGEYHKKGDGYCILGAIAKAYGVSDNELTDNLHFIWLTSDLLRVIGSDFEGIENEWNDEPGRTKGQVIAALMKADKLVRAGPIPKDGKNRKARP